MNKLETLPKMLFYGGHVYMIELHVNFRGNLVIGYRADRDNSILSFVVEPQNEPYIPEGFVTNDGVLNEYIGNMKTLDECIDQIALIIKKNDIQEHV